MTEHMHDDEDSRLSQGGPGDLVHWMEPRSAALGPGGVSAAVAGAFVAGVGVTLAVLATIHWLGPRRAVAPPAGWRRRMLRR